MSRYQLLQALLHLARKELEPNIPLVFQGADPDGRNKSVAVEEDESLVMEESPVCDQEGPIGRGAPMFVLAWACLDALCQCLHGSVETITSEVGTCPQ